MVDEAGEHEGAEESPDHCTTTGDELPLDSEDLIYLYSDLYEDMPILLQPSSELSVCHECTVCPVTMKDDICDHLPVWS